MNKYANESYMLNAILSLSLISPCEVTEIAIKNSTFRKKNK